MAEVRADGKTRAFSPSRRWRAVAATGMLAAFLAADQATKAAMRSAVAQGFVSADLLPGVIELRFAMNTGAAFSMGEGFGFAFVLLALAVLVFTAVYLSRAPRISRLEVIGLGMLAGGAIGNAIDRMAFGYVTDFLATQFIDFPIFNIADIGIACGAVIAFIGVMVSPAGRAGAGAASDDGAGTGSGAGSGSADGRRGGSTRGGAE